MMAEQGAADEYFLQEETETEALAARYEDEMERKMCQVNVVQPFMDKFESSSYNNIEDSYWNYIDKASDKMIRSENMQDEKGCHKVGFQSVEEFEKNLNSTRTEQVIEEINTTQTLHDVSNAHISSFLMLVIVTNTSAKSVIVTKSAVSVTS